MAHRNAGEALWKLAGLPAGKLSRLNLSMNPDPAVDSSFRLGTAAQTSIGLSALSAAYFHELRTGVQQDVQVDARRAVLEFKSEAYYTMDDQRPAGDLFDPLAGTYKTKDDNWVRIHTNFPHHRDGILSVLQCPGTNDAVASALLDWDSFKFEEEAARCGLVATAYRAFDQWDSSPQGKALEGASPVVIRKVAEAPKRDVPTIPPSMPLDGVRVLDLTRVLAGPICGRTLAGHGADVLLVTSPKLPDLPFLDADTSRGKRTTQLDLTSQDDRDKLTSLIKDTDVFLQAYRPGGLAEKGFDVDDIVRLKKGKGVVYASLRAYGWEGPWKDRRGFDSLVQTAMGFNHAEAEAYLSFRNGGKVDMKVAPRAFPMQALDHAAGYLLAFGINAALCKTVTEGGSWEVQVSLAAVGNWIRSLGRLDPQVAFGEGKPLPPRSVPQDQEIAAIAVELNQSIADGIQKIIPEGRKRMSAVRHSAKLSETPVRVGEASMRLNANTPRWLDRI
ncbi:CoA-transferase family III domain-containing protein [Irpex rosettiformis]|uniref:CoA-transferase family III domain-containing protein n=1 Tax=Irpex rosettiformis TaxID=378272 RepID=A0ACB8U2D7_9APHY|nr:CoA-transferase family III domain-containing protein [Irpex rosettiformis]